MHGNEHHDSFLEWMALLTLGILLMVMLFIYIPKSIANQQVKKEPENSPGEFEFPLGSFDCRHQIEGDPDTTRIVKFDVHAHVDGKISDLMMFDRKLGDFQNRIQEVVDETIRECPETHFHENDLGHLKKTLKSRINTMIGKELVDNVIVTKFQMFRLPNQI